MAEIFFILTTVFVAYVVYAVVGDQMDEMKSMVAKAAKAEAGIGAEQGHAKVVAEKVAPKPAAAVKQTVAPKESPRTASANKADEKGLKDPATGEIVNIPNNYRFAKRWIKDALVTEGLLPKVYKNNELDDKTNTKIKMALNKLAKLDPYKA